MTVVVAHLHGLHESTGAIAAGTWHRDTFGYGVILNIPCGPIERRFKFDGAIGSRCGWRRKAEERTVIHFRRIDDLPRIEHSDGVEVFFDCAKRVVDTRAELPLDPLTAAQTVTMFAAVGSFVFTYQFSSFFGDHTHLRGAAAWTALAHVQDRSNMQSADRRMRIPGTARAVLCKDLGQGVGVLGKMLQWHGAVLDKADRLAVALQAHHDVEPRFSYFPKILLLSIVRHFDDPVRQSQLADQVG